MSKPKSPTSSLPLTTRSTTPKPNLKPRNNTSKACCSRCLSKPYAMNTQSEYALEAALIDQLNGMEYASVAIEDEAAMLANLKRQLETHNQGITFTQTEFARILNHLNTGGVFERAKILRDKFALKRDNNDTAYISFMNCDAWCENEFQVTSQVTMQGKRKNRYDVTVLINGLPLVQIELKRRGAELKVAFHQVNRYQHDSYDAGAGLFQYVQLFIISNGVNTKYFANNKQQSFKQTFFWTNKENKRLSDLHEFSADFLKPCHIAKMITHYMVMTEEQVIKVLRPYQFYPLKSWWIGSKTAMTMPISGIPPARARH